MTNSLVKPVICKRCGGTGKVEAFQVHLGVSGLCFKCDGVGQVEGDRATLKAQRAEYIRREDRWKKALVWFAMQPEQVRMGFNCLEALEPVRAEKALDAIVSGHPKVADALVAYRKENFQRFYAR